jgi:hypothetical protein
MWIPFLYSEWITNISVIFLRIYIGVQCSVLSAGEREREREGLEKKKSAFRKSVNVERGGEGVT